MKKNNKFTKRLFELLTIFIFCSVTIIFGILFFILPKEEYSQAEKRYLERFPKFTIESLADGTYTDSITKYVSDNFVLREALVELSGSLEDKRGIRLGDVKLYSSSADTSKKAASIDKPLKRVKKSLFGLETNALGDEERSKINFNSVVENSDIYANLKDDEIKGQQVGALFIIGDTALELFYGNNSYCADYASIISSYKQSLPQNINVYNMVVPTHFEFGLPEKYRSEVGTRQKPFIDHIYSNLDPSVISVDAYSQMEKDYNAGNYMYFRTDHHWTARGAYSAYLAFARTAGFTPTPLSDFEERMVDKFLGTFYTSTYDKKLSENPDFIRFYAPTNTYTMVNYDENGSISNSDATLVYTGVKGDYNGYLVFMGGDKPLSKITTDAGTGRSLLVFKESYGNAFIPYLTRNFDTIYVADIRTFPFNAVDFAVENGITDVLFTNNIMTSCSPPRIRNFLDLMD